MLGNDTVPNERGVWTDLRAVPSPRRRFVQAIAGHLALPALDVAGYDFSLAEISDAVPAAARRRSRSMADHRFRIEFINDPEEFAEVCLRLRLADGSGAKKQVEWAVINRADGAFLAYPGAFCLLIGSVDQPIGFITGTRSIFVGTEDERCVYEASYTLDLRLIYVAEEHRGLFNSHALTTAVDHMARTDLEDIARQIDAGPYAATLNARLRGDVRTDGGLAAIRAVQVSLNDDYADEGGPQQPVGRRYLGYTGCQEAWEN